MSSPPSSRPSAPRAREAKRGNARLVRRHCRAPASTSREIVTLNYLAEFTCDDFIFVAFVECTVPLASLLKQDPVVAPLVKNHKFSLGFRFHVADADVHVVRDRCIELGYTWKFNA